MAATTKKLAYKSTKYRSTNNLKDSSCSIWERMDDKTSLNVEMGKSTSKLPMVRVAPSKSKLPPSVMMTPDPEPTSPKFALTVTSRSMVPRLTSAIVGSEILWSIPYENVAAKLSSPVNVQVICSVKIAPKSRSNVTAVGVICAVSCSFTISNKLTLALRYSHQLLNGRGFVGLLHRSRCRQLVVVDGIAGSIHLVGNALAITPKLEKVAQ
ncbi:hypothetical protein HG531_013141 [Fusarium graminearum]|nr:hypothetical protein HG531_013141 [Fusarium graminearum]